MYGTNEDAGYSYDAVVTAFKMLDSRKELTDFYTQYSSYWFSNISQRVRNLDGYPPFVFGQPLDTNAIDVVLAQNYDSLVVWHNETRDFASFQLKEPTDFHTMRQELRSMSVIRGTSTITDNRIPGGGARFYDRSALYHAGEYKFVAG